MGPQLDHPAHEVSERDYQEWRKAHETQKQRVLQATTTENHRDVYPVRCERSS